MDYALATEALGGEGLYALLRRVRAHLPGRSTLTVSIPAPSRYGAFLSERTEDLRALIPGEHENLGRSGGTVVTLSWHACRREGHDLELIVPPGESGRSVVVVGVSPEPLRAFEEDLRAFCERPEGRALLYSGGEWRSDPELDEEVASVSWDEVVLPAEQKEELRFAAGTFFSRKEAYLSVGFAWRRGVLLVGPPGTGKTMVCKAMAASLGKDVPFLYVRDLSGYDPEEEMIHDVFARARALAPCTLVFEDIDGFVNDHNRAVFLNELDGFRPNEGILVLATSNHPERVDEALLKRPSRFDRVFQMGLPAEAERRRYCALLLSRSESLAEELDVEELAGKVARASEGFTPAYIKEAFVSAALERAHEGAAILDEEFARSFLKQVKALKGYLRESRSPERLADIHGSLGRAPGFHQGPGS